MSAPQNTVQRQGVAVVSADALNTFIQWCPSVATLRTFSALNGMTAILLGLVTVGDGGQGIFSWNSTSTAPDDGVNVIKATGSVVGRWIRVTIVPGGALTVSQNQMRQWAAANGNPKYIYTIDNACPADIANIVNVEWLHGNAMAQGDALYQFIQTTLAFSSLQMQTAFAAMLTYPP